MIFEAATTLLMGGLAVQAHLAQSGLTNDTRKISKIFTLSGLNVKDGKVTHTPQLLKKRQHDWGVEYRYRMPLGRAYEDFAAKQKTLEGGLNSRAVKLRLKDFRSLTLSKPLVPQLKSVFEKRLGERKEIELIDDGALIVRVYEKPLPSRVDFALADGWCVNFGLTREKNAQVQHDFEASPHLAIGGATRYGKSNLINVIIASLLRQQPANTRLYLIDLKGGVELCDYERAVQTAGIAYEPDEALALLERAYNDMRALQAKLRRLGAKNVQQAGIKERAFVIIDEVGELNPTEAVTTEERRIKEGCQRYMSQIARLGAGLGFRQILATQYPTGDVIPRQCKQNSDAKVCFRVQNGTASRVVLDAEGAERLPEIRGRAIYQTADKRRTIQTPLIDAKEIRKAIVEKEAFTNEVIPSDRTPGSDSVIVEETRLS